MSNFVASLLTFTGINILLAYSVYAPLLTGQLNLGAAGFMAVGAYTSSILSVQFGMPLPAALLIGTLVAGLFGLIIGLPSLRLHGIYLAMGTLAFGEMVRSFFLNSSMAGGSSGIRGMTGTTPGLVCILVLVVFLLFVLLAHTPLGLVLESVRDAELASRTLGVFSARLKVLSFGVSGMLAGLAGGLFAHYSFFIEPGEFTFILSIDVALFVILGGMNHYAGPLLGATIFTLLPEFTRFFQDWRGAVFGLLIIVLLNVRPDGVLLRDYLRINPRILPGMGSKTDE